MHTEPADYERLLDGLNESREHLRVMHVSDEQQNVDLTKAFYRLDSAAAAIRSLLAQKLDKQVTRAFTA